MLFKSFLASTSLPSSSSSSYIFHTAHSHWHTDGALSNNFRTSIFINVCWIKKMAAKELSFTEFMLYLQHHWRKRKKAFISETFFSCLFFLQFSFILISFVFRKYSLSLLAAAFLPACLPLSSSL